MSSENLEDCQKNEQFYGVGYRKQNQMELKK